MDMQGHAMATGYYIGLGDRITQQAATKCKFTMENGQQIRVAQIDHIFMYADDFLTSIEG